MIENDKSWTSDGEVAAKIVYVPEKIYEIQVKNCERKKLCEYLPRKKAVERILWIGRKMW